MIKEHLHTLPLTKYTSKYLHRNKHFINLPRASVNLNIRITHCNVHETVCKAQVHSSNSSDSPLYELGYSGQYIFRK